jgi:hypothetical protein
MRSSVVSFAVTTLWTVCFLLTYTSPLLNAAPDAAGTFWTYATICLAGVLFLYFRLPETKRSAFEEIETGLRTSKS